MAVVSRAIALALLLVLAGNTALPAFFADPQANLPACCRRDGKHHCAMMDMAQQQEDNAGPSWTAAKCPQFPKNSAPFCTVKPAPPQPSTLVTGLVSGQPTVKAHAEVLYRVSHSRTRQKRGPPSFI